MLHHEQRCASSTMIILRNTGYTQVLSEKRMRMMRMRMRMKTADQTIRVYTRLKNKKIGELRISFEERKFAGFKFAIQRQNRKLKSRNYLTRKK